MKHILKGLVLVLGLIFLTACESPISEGTIVNKHMTEEHTESSVIWVEDMPIFSEDEIPDKYYFDVTGKDKDGRGHTVTVQVDKKAYDHHKVGDYWRITVKR